MRSLLTLLALATTFCMVVCDDASLLPNHDIYHTRYEGYPRYKDYRPRRPVRFEPCRTKLNYNCLRNYFGKYGRCSRVNVPIENPTYYDLDLPLYIPVAKAVAIVVDATLSNLDGRVERFYEEDGNLVITVRFRGLTGDAPGAIFVIDRDGEEPAVIKERGKATYPTDMTLTAVLPKENGMISRNSLRNAHYYAYFPKIDASFYLGPKLTQSSDPAVQEMVSAMTNNVADACKQIFRTKATFYFLAFLQSYICDFGVQPLRGKYDTSLVSLVQDVDTSRQTKIKPCARFVDKNACVREIFKAYQTCAPIYYPKPSPLIRNNYLAYIPSVNSTAVLPYSEVSGLNGRIKDFYINEEAQVCVVVVEFKGLAVDTEDTEIIHYREGEVPRSITGLTTVRYHVTLTATLSLKDGGVVTRESVEKAFVSAAADACDTTIEFGCNIADSKDPEVQAVVRGVQEHLMKVVGEIMVTSANSHFTNFMQSNICDWAIPTWYSKFF